MGPDTKLGKALSAPGGAFTDFSVFNSRAVRARPRYRRPTA